MQPYKYTGLVHSVGKTQTWPSGFAKRTLVLEQTDSGDSKYKNYAAFDFTKGKSADHTRDLDGLRQGDLVEVSFFTDARESQKNAGQWFVTNRAVKVERMTGVAAQTVELTKIAEPDPEDDPSGDMPF